MDAITITEAARRLNVSVVKVRLLVREGILPATVNPLDKREKLVPVAAVEELEQQGRTVERPWPRTIGIISDPDFQSEYAEDYMDAHRDR